jgi:hypothetical protein
MSAFDVVFVFVCYEVVISKGCGFALCLRDECV